MARSKPTANPKARTPVAGPSSRKQANHAREEVEEVGSGSDVIEYMKEEEEEEATEGEARDEDEVEVVVAQAKAKGQPKAKVPPKTNGKGTGKGQQRKAVTSDIEMLDEETSGRTGPPKAQPPSTSVSAPRKPKADALLRRQLDAALLEAKNALEREALARDKFEKLYKSRQQGDALVEAQLAEAEAQLETQAALIKEYRAVHEATHKLSLSKPGLLHFHTREAAQRERQGVEDELAALRDENASLRAALADKDRQHLLALKAKDDRATELNHDLQLARSDLKAEIERAKTLANTKVRGSSSTPAVQQRSVPNPLDGAQRGAVATQTLYEDLTNILVVKVKWERGQYFDVEETEYHCVCTAGNRSLNFMLRCFHEPEEGADLNNLTRQSLVEQCKYTPIDLSKESDEFLARLDFLTEPFTFVRTQMDVFAKTLVEHLIPLPEETEAGDDE